MSWLDTIGKKLFPLASAEERAEARRKAEAIARDNEWLAMILDAHREFESHIQQALDATDRQDRLDAMRQAFHLNARHSIAEEVSIYPALVDHNGSVSGKLHAGLAYEEQQIAKIEQAKLEMLDPMGEEWRDKMEHLKSATLQHVYSEENTWFPELAENATPEKRKDLSRKYADAFERYGGKSGGKSDFTAGGAMAAAEPPDVPPVSATTA